MKVVCLNSKDANRVLLTASEKEVQVEASLGERRRPVVICHAHHEIIKQQLLPSSLNLRIVVDLSFPDVYQMDSKHWIVHQLMLCNRPSYSRVSLAMPESLFGQSRKT